MRGWLVKMEANVVLEILRKLEANREIMHKKKICFLSSLDRSTLKKIYFHSCETDDVRNVELCLLAGADINWQRGEGYPVYGEYHRMMDRIVELFMAELKINEDQ